MGNRRIGRALVAAAGRLGTDPSDCRCSYNSAAAAVVLTSVVVDNTEKTFQPADDTAGVAHHTGQAYTAAAADCMAALNTHNYALFLSNRKNTTKTSLKSHINHFSKIFR